MQLSKTVDVAQLVRASVCGTEGRGFEPHHLPVTLPEFQEAFFFIYTYLSNKIIRCSIFTGIVFANSMVSNNITRYQYEKFPILTVRTYDGGGNARLR